jgi:hypothetical protein
MVEWVDDSVGDGGGDEEDRCPTLQEPSFGGDGCPYASSPSRSLLELGFYGFVVPLYVQSMI